MTWLIVVDQHGDTVIQSWGLWVIIWKFQLWGGPTTIQYSYILQRPKLDVEINVHIFLLRFPKEDLVIQVNQVKVGYVNAFFPTLIREIILINLCRLFQKLWSRHHFLLFLIVQVMVSRVLNRLVEWGWVELWIRRFFLETAVIWRLPEYLILLYNTWDTQLLFFNPVHLLVANTSAKTSVEAAALSLIILLSP